MVESRGLGVVAVDSRDLGVAEQRLARLAEPKPEPLEASRPRGVCICSSRSRSGSSVVLRLRDSCSRIAGARGS